MEKLMKTAKKLDTFFKVLQKIMQVLIIVVACIGVAAVVATVFMGAESIISERNVVDIGFMTLTLAEGYALDYKTVLAYCGIALILVMVLCVGALFILGQIRKILRPMMEGNPFDATVSVNIRKMAYASIVMGIVVNVVYFIETLVTGQYLRLLELEKIAGIQSVTMNYTYDLSFLIVFFILLLVSYIFRYGEELQTQVDETL